jgi:hypothetical protein
MNAISEHEKKEDKKAKREQAKNKFKGNAGR